MKRNPLLYIPTSNPLYPLQVTGNDRNNMEAAHFVFDWTYGIAWGAVIFLCAATVCFLVRLREEDNALPMKASADKPTVYYLP